MFVLASVSSSTFVIFSKEIFISLLFQLMLSSHLRFFDRRPHSERILTHAKHNTAKRNVVGVFIVSSRHISPLLPGCGEGGLGPGVEGVIKRNAGIQYLMIGMAIHKKGERQRKGTPDGGNPYFVLDNLNRNVVRRYSVDQ